MNLLLLTSSGWQLCVVCLHKPIILMVAGIICLEMNPTKCFNYYLIFPFIHGQISEDGPSYGTLATNNMFHIINQEHKRNEFYTLLLVSLKLRVQ